MAGFAHHFTLDLVEVTLDLYLANKVELDSLRACVEQAQADAAKLEPPDPATRELLYRQQQLLKSLLNLAPTAGVECWQGADGARGA